MDCHSTYNTSPFRYVDRVVCWLVELVQNAHISLCGSCCCEHGCAELVFVYSLRAAEGEEDAAWLNLLECFFVESGIALQCVAQGILVFCKCRWVKHDEIVRSVHVVEKLECVLCKGLVTAVARKVERDVGIGQVYSFL